MNEIFSNLGAANPVDRRTLLRRAGIGGASLVAGSLLAGCGGSDHNNRSNNGGSNGNNGTSGSLTNPTDVDVLNFALNLEYLEGAYYTLGTGQYINGAEDLTGSGTQGDVVGGRQVSLSSLRPYFNEIAYDESNHIRALRAAITARGGTPIARPAINFTSAFAAAGASAGTPGFDPFVDETSFLLGGFLLSDVGVTAYVGGSQFIDDQAARLAAASLLATEAYHVGSIRTLIANVGGDAVIRSRGIASARNTLDIIPGEPVVDDQGVDEDPNVPGAHNIALTNPQGLAFGRSVRQVLSQVYLTNASGAQGGGFFPNGTNGGLRTI